jgi:hypothetical protein
MMLVIRTQYRENYGTETDPYWKSKGGQEFKVINLPTNTSEEFLLHLVDSLLPQVQYENSWSMQYMLDWSLEDDSYLSWFEKSQLEYDGEILFAEPIINYEEMKEAA